MKLTKSKLKQIIKEELDTLMNEEEDVCAKLHREWDALETEMRSDPNSQAGMGFDGIRKQAKEAGCAGFEK